MDQKTKTLSASIEKVIDKLQAKRQEKGAKIYCKWSKIVGNVFAKHCSPVDLKDETLIINVESSAWMYMLRLKQGQILEELNKISAQKIKAIKLRIGKIF